MPSRTRRCAGSPTRSVPVEGQRAGIGLIDAADQIEQRRLAGAVRPDQREDRARRDGERDVAHRVHAAEALVQALRAAAARVIAQCSARSAEFLATTRAACTSPPGMNSTTSVSATP